MTQDLNSLPVFLQRAWDHYVEVAPDARRVEELLLARGETLVNDHVAFRTFNRPGLSRGELGRVFVDRWGYRVGGELDFPEKKLQATYYLPPEAEESRLPKIFVSELVLERVSAELRDWLEGLCAPAGRRASALGPESFFEPAWDPIRLQDYRRFYAESEYACWTAAFGIRVNHFTVLFNALRTFPGGLAQLNAFLIENGLALNSAGGLIKGTPLEFLEQSSTLARSVPTLFADAPPTPIPGCYTEFARRYVDPATGRLFTGFIPKSADKIFESTRS